MLTIPKVSLLRFPKVQYNPLNNSNNNQTITGFAPVYRKSLSSDVVQFTGANKNDHDDIRILVESYRTRISPRIWFNDQDIQNITERVTPKSEPFLEDILSLSNKKLNAASVIELLDYLNEESTDAEEFNEKLSTFKDLKNIVKQYSFRPSVLAEHLDEIPNRGIVDILKSDLLLRQTKHNFNSFTESYNNVAKYFDDTIKKLDGPVTDSTKHYKAREMMLKTFSSMLLLGMVFDKSVLNELVYNRGQYLNSLYMTRLRLLNEDDLHFLRKVQTSAITEKENKGGDLAVYEVSLDDKIHTLNLLAANREIINSGHEGINFYDYIKPVNTNNASGNFKIDFQNIKIDLMDKVLRRIGVEDKIVDRYMNNYRFAYEQEPDLRHYRSKVWDINYSHLLNAPEGSLLRDIIVAASTGNWKKFLYEEGPIAEINKKNAETFKRNGINYDNWLDPTIMPISRKFVDKTGVKEKVFTVKNWKRIPQESLFDGNYTTCCTGIDKDQGESFPKFLTNTSTTTLEVRTEKNKVIAMSRILMAKINGKLSMVVENIEVNNKMAKHYLYNDEQKYRFREMIFDYAREYAKDINNTDEEIPVYFSSKYYKVKDIEKGLETGKRYEDVQLIGEFPDNIYINAYGGRYDRTKVAFADDGDGFALHLSNITHKAKPTFEIKNTPTNVDSDDSIYNYADTERFNHFQ